MAPPPAQSYSVPGPSPGRRRQLTAVWAQRGNLGSRGVCIFNCEHCVLCAGIFLLQSTSNVNAAVSLRLTPGNGKLTHLPIKEACSPPPPPVHVSCGRTDILLVRLPPTPVVWRNGGGAADVRVARRFFFQQTLLPLPPPKVQRLEAQPPQTFTRQRLCPTVQERPPVRVNLLIACRTPSETQPPMGQGSPASTLRGSFRLERSSGDKDVLQADRSGDQGLQHLGTRGRRLPPWIQPSAAATSAGNYALTQYKPTLDTTLKESSVQTSSNLLTINNHISIPT